MRGNVKATIAIILLLGVIATAIIAVISDGFTLPVEEWGAKFDIKDNVDDGQVDDDKTPGTNIPVADPGKDDSGVSGGDAGDTQTPEEKPDEDLPEDPEPLCIQIGNRDKNTIELHPYEYYKFLIGEGENPMPDDVTVIYSDDSTQTLPVVWKNQEGEVATAKDYVSEWYANKEEHDAAENFIVGEVAIAGQTYIFPMNVRIYSGVISTMEFLIDGEYVGSVPKETTYVQARVTFTSGLVVELPSWIKPSTSQANIGYAYIGYDIDVYSGELVDFEGHHLKQSRRITRG